MMSFCFGLLASVFVEAGFALIFISLTAGEMGFSHKSQETSIKTTRFAEYTKVAAQFSAQEVKVLGHPDMGLALLSHEEKLHLYADILDIFRVLSPSIVVSFNSQEVSAFIHHPDHVVTGQAVEWAASASDVVGVTSVGGKSVAPANSQRPELLLWTSSAVLANAELQLSEEAVTRRNTAATEIYASQPLPTWLFEKLQPTHERYTFIPRYNASNDSHKDTKDLHATL